MTKADGKTDWCDVIEEEESQVEVRYKKNDIKELIGTNQQSDFQ